MFFSLNYHRNYVNYGFSVSLYAVFIAGNPVPLLHWRNHIIKK